ncbi:MAG: DUF2321 domain-containing protein [Phycisphaerae bacterium]
MNTKRDRYYVTLKGNGAPWGATEFEKRRGHETALVCEKGHVINEHVDQRPEDNANFCEKCGARAVSVCECGAPIRGGGYCVFGFFKPPAHCRVCGRAHIWTERKAEALKEFLAEIDGISPDELAKLVDVVPDVITETNRTETAAVRFGKLLKRVGPTVISLLTDILKQIGTAVFLKKIGLDN